MSIRFVLIQSVMMYLLMIGHQLSQAQDISIEHMAKLNADKNYAAQQSYFHSRSNELKDLSLSDQVAAYHYLSRAYSNTKQYDKEKQTLQKAAMLIDQLPQDSVGTKLYMFIAHSIAYLPDNIFGSQEATDILESCLKRIEDNPYASLEEKANLRMSAASANFSLNQFATGFAHLDSVRTMSQHAPDSIRQSLEKSRLAIKGIGYRKSQQPIKAIKVTEDLLTLALEDRDSSAIASHYSQLGIAYFQVGQYGNSEHHLSKAIQYIIPLYGAESPSAIQGYNNLGVINMKLERYDIASMYYKKNEILIPKKFGKNSIRMGQLYFNLGVGHFQRAEYNQALEYFNKSIEIRKKIAGNNNLDVAHCMQLIGQCHQQDGRYEEALKWQKESLAIRLNLSNIHDPEVVRLYTSIGTSELKIKRNAEGLSNLEKACTSLAYDQHAPFNFDSCIAPSLLFPILQSYILFYTGEYSENSLESDFEKGEKFIAIVDSLANHVKHHLDDPATRRQVLSNFHSIHGAKIHHYYNRFKKQPSDAIIEKAYQTFEESNNSYKYELHMENGKTMDAPEELITAKKTLQDSIAKLKFELAKTSTQNEKSKHLTIVNNLNQTRDRYFDLIQTIKNEAPKFYSAAFQFPKQSFKAITNNLNEDEDIVLYYQGHVDLHALKLEKNNVDFISLGEIDTILPKITSFIEQVQDRTPIGELNELSEQLYNILIKPLNLKVGNRITISSNGLISLLPFDIIYNPETNDVIGSHHNIHYKHSFTLSNQNLVEQQTKSPVLAMAPMTSGSTKSSIRLDLDDIFRDEIVDLPGSSVEVNNIGKLFHSNTLVGADATESAFKTLASSAKIIHLATHGFVNHDDPNKSRLYFNNQADSSEDGKLHAFEIVNLPLQAELVTLSACNTGVGRIENGEGIASLGRAFNYAGCENQLISLWPVNDRTTQQIMQLYYQNIDAGIGKADALINAKKEYVASAPDQFQHPYFWAGFVYYGDNEPMTLRKPFSNRVFIFGAIALGLILIMAARRRKKRVAA